MCLSLSWCYSRFNRTKTHNYFSSQFCRYLHFENEQASVDTLIKFLQTEAELEERFANELSLNVTSKPKSSTINQVRSNSDDRCTICNKPRHKFVECEKFMSCSPQRRTDAMRRLHRCFTCLSPMHKDPRDCYYRRRCTSCSRSHHTLLACVSKPEQNKIRVENTQQNSSLNANASSFQPSQPFVRSTNECAPNFRYSPTALVKLLLLLFFFVLFIFILHSRESELHCYILDGKSALAWELPFP